MCVLLVGNGPWKVLTLAGSCLGEIRLTWLQVKNDRDHFNKTDNSAQVPGKHTCVPYLEQHEEAETVPILKSYFGGLSGFCGARHSCF